MKNSIFLIIKKNNTRVRSAMVQGLLSLGTHRKNFSLSFISMKKNFLFIKIFFKNFCTRLRSTIFLQFPKRDFRIIYIDALS